MMIIFQVAYAYAWSINVPYACFSSLFHFCSDTMGIEVHITVKHNPYLWTVVNERQFHGYFLSARSS
jgi:hypothetical protein